MSKNAKLGIIVMAMLMAIGLNVSIAKAAVLNFDTFLLYESVSGSGYGGFGWGPDIIAISESEYNSVWSNSVAFPSDPIAVFNGFGTSPRTITRASDFDFEGAEFTTWSSGDDFWEFSSTSITMKGYDDAALIGEVTYDLTNDFAFYTANFSSIDTLELFASSEARWWGMDNFTYHEPTGGNGVIPEPTTMSLLGLGLLGLVKLRKK